MRLRLANRLPGRAAIMLCVLGCSEPEPAARPDAVDAARPDAAPLDAAPLDAAPLDAAPLDAAPLDAAPLDAAPLDAAPLDAAPLDAATAAPTSALLESFYAEHGGRARFAEPIAAAVEAMLLAEDDVAAGDLASARARIEAVFAAWPYASDGWPVEAPAGLNLGSPVAYYGLRMLETIVAAGPLERTGTLHMTAIVARCATVTRPTLPDLAPETVPLELDPEVLANNAQVLRESTDLFRHWVTAITRGLAVELRVEVMEGCATVTYTDDGRVIVSYPNTDEMVAGIPEAVARDTDFFWVVAPSGVPGDGSGYGRHFITGGMGGIGARPLFLSDDGWFVRKPEHLGRGRYHPLERRVYLPQWFQHEFMHHLFRTWPQFALEASDHQWFDRSTWPEDFSGRFEPDYYAEAIHKRLLDASPSLAEGLQGVEYADLDVLALAAIEGTYQRTPVLNDWHLVTVTAVGPREARWTNQAGVSWSLSVREGALFSGEDCPYGEVRLDVELDGGGQVAALWFGGERYGRPD
jgi:hypothetical protein